MILRGLAVESRTQDKFATRCLHFSFAFQSLGYPLAGLLLFNCGSIPNIWNG